MSMYNDLLSKKKLISITGLGYVGLPLALAFAKYFKVIGLDINADRVKMMREGIDPSQELDPKEFMNSDIEFTSDPEDLVKAHFHIIAVPTDIDLHKVPNLTPLLKASESVGRALKKGDYVVYESTVYPGCTEEDCLPVLEAAAKSSQLVMAKASTSKFEESQDLKAGIDFKYGYSPERIVPGDKVRTLTKILKIVSGNDEESLEVISEVYGKIIEAGVFKASSVKVAEAAKVIENTQRDINISLMNELSIIFDRMGISTKEVIEAAGTKWNFHKYQPGLVGGHCISVDPYYLLHKSKQLGHDPQVIAAGRRINDEMPAFIAKRLVQMLIEKGKNPGESKVLVMGVTFKEDVADIRNSKVVDLVTELMDYSLNVHVVDHYASPNEIAHEYKIALLDEPSKDYDAIIVAVAHKKYVEMDAEQIKKMCSSDQPILIDLKGVFPWRDKDLHYWSL